MFVMLLGGRRIDEDSDDGKVREEGGMCSGLWIGKRMLVMLLGGQKLTGTGAYQVGLSS